MSNIYLRIPQKATNLIEKGSVYSIAADRDESAIFALTNVWDLPRYPQKNLLAPSSYTHGATSGGGEGCVDGVQGSGFEAVAILVKTGPGSTQGYIDGIRVVKRGKGYHTAPTVTFGSYTFTAVLGDKSTTDSYDHLQIVSDMVNEEDGSIGGAQKVNRASNSDIFFDATDLKNNNMIGPKLSTTGGAQSFYKTLTTKSLDDLKELSVLNTYNRHVDASDNLRFWANVAGTWQAVKTHNQIEDAEAAVISANHRIDILNSGAWGAYIEELSGWHAENGRRDQQAIDLWDSGLAAFQNDTGLDLGDFSSWIDPSNEPYTELDQVYNDIVKTLSFWGDIFTEDMGWLKYGWNQEDVDALLEEWGGDPTYAIPGFVPPTYDDEPQPPTSLGHIAIPEEWSQQKKMAAFFIWKSVCFAGLALLAHIYEFLKSSSYEGEVKTSVHKWNSSPNCLRTSMTSGVLVNWIKAEIRAHDVFGQACKLFSGLWGNIKSVFGWIAELVKGKSYDARIMDKVEALFYSAAAAAAIESLKGVYRHIDTWLEAMESFNDWDTNHFAYFAWLEHVQGMIAVKLDEISWLMNPNNGVKNKAQVFNTTLQVRYPGIFGYPVVPPKDWNGKYNGSTLQDSTGSGALYTGWITSNMFNQTMGWGTYSPAGTFLEIYGNRTVKHFGGSTIDVKMHFVNSIPTNLELIGDGAGGKVTGGLQDGPVDASNKRIKTKWWFAPIVRVTPAAWDKDWQGVWSPHQFVTVGQSAEISPAMGHTMAEINAAVSEEANKRINSSVDGAKLKDEYKALWDHASAALGFIQELMNENPYGNPLSGRKLKVGGFPTLAGKKISINSFHFLGVPRHRFTNILTNYNEGEWKKLTSPTYKDRSWRGQNTGEGMDETRSTSFGGQGGIVGSASSSSLGKIRLEILDKVRGNLQTPRSATPVKSNDLYQRMQEYDAYLFTPGKCDPKVIQGMNDQLAKRFFADPAAYVLGTMHQKIKESLCQRKACGVAHSYVSAPPIGENYTGTWFSTNNSTGNQNVGTTSTGAGQAEVTGMTSDFICGNSRVKHNLHPTIEWWNSTNQQAGFWSVIFNKPGITGTLRIEKDVTPVWSVFDSTGSHGDYTMPQVWGNWTFALGAVDKTIRKTNKKQKGFLYWVKKIFRIVARVAAEVVTVGLYGTFVLKDPRIDHHMTKSTQDLINAYNKHRLYKYDYTEKITSSIIDISHLAPIKNDVMLNTVSNFWGNDDTSEYIRVHQEALKNAYKKVAEATGIYAWEKELPDSKNINATLSTAQTFQGLCKPIVRQYGISKRPWLARVEGELPDSWGPMANKHKDRQEISITKNEDTEDASRKRFGRSNNASQVVDAYSDENYREKFMVDKDAPWKSLVKQLDGKLVESNGFSTLLIDDFLYRAQARQSGLAAGGNAALILDKEGNIIDGMNEEGVAQHGVDIKGYSAHVAQYKGNGFWKNDIQNGCGAENFEKMEYYDSDSAKYKYRVPVYTCGAWQGGSMISGEMVTGEKLAYESASGQYDLYRDDANIFHYTGITQFQTGIRVTAPCTVVDTDPKGCWQYIKTGYNQTILLEAQDSAFSQLSQVPGWQEALTKKDGNGNILAVSGVMLNESVAATFKGCGANPVWEPIEPAILGWGEKEIKAVDCDEGTANLEWAASKAASSDYSACGCVWGPTGKIPFTSSYTASPYLTSGEARTAAKNWQIGYDHVNFLTHGQGCVEDWGVFGNNVTFTETCNNCGSGNDVSNSINCHGGVPITSRHSTCPNYWAEYEFQRIHRELGYASGLDPTGGLDLDLYRCESDLTTLQCEPEYEERCEVGVWHESHNTGRDRFWSVVDRMRSGQYAEARYVITNALESPCSSTVYDDSQEGDCNDQGCCSGYTESDAYTYGHIESGTYAVFPHTGAFHLLNYGTGTGITPHACSGMVGTTGSNGWWSHTTRSAAYMTNLQNTESDFSKRGSCDGTHAAGTYNSNLENVINLKDYCPTGDIDIYVKEDLNFSMESFDSTQLGEAWPNGSPAQGCYCYNHFMTSDNYSGVTIWELGHYYWDTMVVQPNNISDPGGTLVECGGSGYWSSTVDWHNPTVITGSGRCPNYNGTVFKSTVTGRIDELKMRGWIQLLKSTYNGQVTASGWCPTITGIVDWSATHRQIWEEEEGLSLNNTEWQGLGLTLPKVSGINRVSERYYIKYEDGVTGMYTSYNVTGQMTGASGQAKLAKARLNWNARYAKGEVGENFDSKMSKLGSGSIDYQITTVDEKDKDYRPVFLGGWPVKNQTNSDFTEGFHKNSSFGRKLVMLDENEYKHDKRSAAYMADRQAMRGLLDYYGINQNKFIYDSEGDFGFVRIKDPDDYNDFVKKIRGEQNLKDMNNGIISVSWDGNSPSVEVRVSENGKGERVLRRPIQQKNKAWWGKPYSKIFMFTSYEIQAAACDHCLADPVTSETYEEGLDGGLDQKVSAQDDVVFFGENYRHGLQIDWELRSGNWQFEVPYFRPGQTFVVDNPSYDPDSIETFESQKEITVTSRNWFEYIERSFRAQQGGVDYTGHYTLYGLPYQDDGQSYPTQLTCQSTDHSQSAETQKSKADKIYDFHASVNQKGSYRSMKDAGEHQIDFKMGG